MSAKGMPDMAKFMLLGITMAGCMVLGNQSAAQAYTPVAITPVPDVYTYLSENPALHGIYGQQTTGQFTRLTIFGNSYADWGNAVAAGFSLYNASTHRYGNALSMGDAMEFHYELPTNAVANYAVGGAKSGVANVYPVPALEATTGIQAQIEDFIAAGGHFSPTDLVDITTVGGNDILNISTEGVSGAANGALEAEKIDVSLLAGAGARTIAILAGDDVSLLPAVAPGGLLSFITPAEAHAFYLQLFPAEEQAFAQYNYSPTRIFFFDMPGLEQDMIADPSKFGFTTTATACIASPACLAAPVAVQDQTMTYDGLHFTTLGFAWVSRFEANQIDAPATLAAQSELALAGTRAFSASVFERLDDERFTGNSGSPLSVYLQGTERAGKQDDQDFALGMHYSAPGLTLGVEDRINPSLTLGLAFNYSTPQAALDQAFGTIRLNSEQLAAYASWSNAGYFADFIAALGRSDYTIRRPGVFDGIGGVTNGADVAAAARVGDLLLRLGALKAGPVVGLDYAGLHENGYTESGDFLLSQVVGGQTLNSLLGSAGLQLRATGPVNAYLDLTAVHEFLNTARDLTTSQLSTPEIVVATPVAGTGTQTFAKIAAGASVRVTGNLSINAALATEFAGAAGAQSFSAEAGLSYRF